MKTIIKNDSGVSPIIGILLLLVITTIISVGVLALALSFQLPTKAPMSVIVAENGAGISGMEDIKITHKGGDGLDALRWSLSLVPAGNQPSFQRMNTGFTVGSIITSTIRTDGSGRYEINNGVLISDTITAGFRIGDTIHVQIKDNPSQSLILDTMVVIR